jgi:hypothetical protein
MEAHRAWFDSFSGASAYVVAAAFINALVVSNPFPDGSAGAWEWAWTVIFIMIATGMSYTADKLVLITDDKELKARIHRFASIVLNSFAWYRNLSSSEP